MIRHMVLWMLKEEAKATEQIKEENIAKQTKRSYEMKEHCPMMKDIKVCRGVRQGKDVYDFAVIMDFDTLEDLEAFEVSPNHSDPEARKFGMSIREKKAVIDLEV